MPLTDEPSPEGSAAETIANTPFQPLKPEVVQPNPSSPAPSSDPGVHGGTSGEDDEAAQQQAQAAEQEPPPEFDPRYAEEFTGLLYLGRLEKTLSLWGHTIVIKTLTTEEHAEVGLLVAKYEGTRSQNAVYQAAVVGAAVVSADGKPLAQPLGPDLSEAIRLRYEYVLRNWMPPVRNKIFEEVYILEAIADEVLKALGNPSG